MAGIMSSLTQDPSSSAVRKRKSSPGDDGGYRNDARGYAPSSDPEDAPGPSSDTYSYPSQRHGGLDVPASSSPGSGSWVATPAKKSRTSEAARGLGKMEVKDEYDMAFDDSMDLDVGETIRVKDEDEEDLEFKPLQARTNAGGAGGERKRVNALGVKVNANAKPAPEAILSKPLPAGVKGLSKNSAWNTMDAEINVTSAPTAAAYVEPPTKKGAVSAANAASVKAAGNIRAEEDDGSVRFYWFDYSENQKDSGPDKGSVYLYGKVYDRAASKWVSCCVTVRGIQRNLYFLPRPRKFGRSPHPSTVPLFRVAGRLTSFSICRAWTRD